MQQTKKTDDTQTSSFHENIEIFRQYHKTKIFDKDGKIINSDKKLRNQLSEKNSKLVSFVVNRYYASSPEFRILKEDLIQEGNLGLLTAIDKFDPERGCQFSTYAVNWIQQACSCYLMYTRPEIHVPAHIRIALNKIVKYMKANDVNSLKSINHKDLQTLNITEKMKGCVDSALCSKNIHSMEEPLSSSSTATYADLVPSNQPSGEDQADLSGLIAIAKKSLMALTPKERYIILLRYNIIQEIQGVKS